MIIMVAFNWSHARAGRAETQLELCQDGTWNTRPGEEREERERQQTK